MRAWLTTIGLVLITAPVRVAADMVTIEPVRDNSIFSEAESSNGAGRNLFAGNTARGNTRRALLAFDVAAAIPPGSTVRSATLSLFVNRTRAGDVAVELRRITADWGEGTSDAEAQEGRGAPATPGDATWTKAFFDATAWGTPGGDVAPGPSATTTVGDIGSYTWGPAADMTADVQAWLDTPGAAFGWAVIADESRPETSKRFASREHTATDTRPVLAVEFDPAGPPTPTPTPSRCPGDCNGDGAVTVDELVRAVNIALGNTGAPSCPAADRNSDGAVTIDELVAATGASLTGCP